VAFDAFISYSHAADDALAPSVQRGLQTLARPWNRRRALEVFRDQTGLAVSPGLWSSIQAGLDESEHFVLLASPEAAASTWVNQEIEHWSASHPIDRLLPVVTAGEWIWDPGRGDFDWDHSSAVPPALRDKFREEPRHLDLRWARTETDLDLRNSRFREAIAQLAAPMHHMSPQDLESSDVARFRHLVRIRRAVVAVLAVLLVLVSVAGVLAVRNAREAQQQQELAEQQARLSLSLRLLAEAQVLSDSQKTLSLLLAAEATRLAPAEAWDALVTGLQDTPGLDRIYDIPGGADADTAVSAVDVAANTYASVTQQEDVQLWELDSGKRRGDRLDADELYRLSPTELAFSPDLTLAVAYRCLSPLCDNSQPGIHLWDPETRQRRFLPQSAGSSQLTFSGGGDLLAASAPNGSVQLWDVATGQPHPTIPVRFPGRPTGLAFSPDDKLLAQSQRDDGRILVWDVDRPQSFAPVHIPFPAEQYPADIAFGSGDVLASQDSDGSVRLWDGRSGRPRGTLKTGSVPTVSLAIGPDGTLATASGNGNLSLWDVERGKQKGSETSSGSRGGPDVLFDQEGSLVSIGSDIRSWDVSRWGQIGEEIYHHQAAVTALAINSDGLLASGDERGVIRLWDLGSGQPSGPPLSGDRSGITALAFGSAGVLGSGDQGGTVRLWDTATGRETRRPLEGHDGAVASLSFSSDGASLAAGYRPGPNDPDWQRGRPIHVWDAASGAVIERPDIGFEGGVASVAFSPIGRFASAGADYLASWDTEIWDSQIIAEDYPRGGPYTAVAFSPDGKTLASSAIRFTPGDNRTVILWAMPSGAGRAEQLGEPLEAGRTRTNDGSFGALAFSPNGDLLAGAGKGGVQLWDVPSHEPIGERLGSFSASSIAVSPDGSQVIVGDSAGVVQAYPATIDDWLRSACALVSRNLSQRERDSYLGSEAPDQTACPEYG